MKRIILTFWLLLVFLSALWVLADTPLPQPLNYFSFRRAYVQYTGIISIALFTIAIMLALRPYLLEKPLGGLDKMYRLHKWLGIGGLVFATLHWWLAQGTKWMVAWGWLERPQKRQRGSLDLTDLEQWVRQQKGLAEDIGEWAFYGCAALIVFALIKAIPYHWFRKTHKLLALAYLPLAWHSLVLIQPSYWSQPVFWVVLALIVAAVPAALLLLLGQAGSKRKVKGKITFLQYYPGVRAIEGEVHLEPGWPGHKPGQFAFVTSQKHEGAHPYTIASAWDHQNSNLTFIVKSLGDWTSQLPGRLTEGATVQVEGPYGCFDFDDQAPRQIWIGAGIGITPFVAKMKHRAQDEQFRHQPVDLFHVTRDYDEGAIQKLMADAEAAAVTLHLWVTPKDGRLTPELIRSRIPTWPTASVWYCGPSGFAKVLRKDFMRHNLAPGSFHQELFEMR